MVSKGRGRVYTSLGGMYKKYIVSGVDGSGRSRGSDLYLDTMSEVKAYVKELMGENRFVVIHVHRRATALPKKGYVATRRPEYNHVKTYTLRSGGWK